MTPNDYRWWTRYEGIKYADCNCAELAERVQREVFGRELSLPEARRSIGYNSRLIEANLGNYGLRTESPTDGDAVLFVNGHLWHVGTFFRHEDVNFVLHTSKKSIWSMTHAIRDLNTLNLKIEGFYQWKTGEKA